MGAGGVAIDYELSPGSTSTSIQRSPEPWRRTKVDANGALVRSCFDPEGVMGDLLNDSAGLKPEARATLTSIAENDGEIERLKCVVLHPTHSRRDGFIDPSLHLNEAVSGVHRREEARITTEHGLSLDLQSLSKLDCQIIEVAADDVTVQCHDVGADVDRGRVAGSISTLISRDVSRGGSQLRFSCGYPGRHSAHHQENGECAHDRSSNGNPQWADLKIAGGGEASHYGTDRVPVGALCLEEAVEEEANRSHHHQARK